MDTEEKQLLQTTAWLFMLHGRADRARNLVEYILSEEPTAGLAASILAAILLDAHAPDDALTALRNANFPPSLARAEALLETRALRDLGRTSEATSRWNRFLQAQKGAQRQWIS